MMVVELEMGEIKQKDIYYNAQQEISPIRWRITMMKYAVLHGYY